MKSYLYAGSAVAALLCAAPVYALDGSVTPDVVLKIGGASAQDQGIDAALTPWANNMTRFINTGASGFPGNNYSAWFFNAKAGNPFGWATNAKVKIIKRSQGGSLAGVQQVLQGAPTGMMVVDGTCTPAGAAVQSCPNVDATLPDGALSDVESTIWKARGALTGTLPNYTEQSCAGQAFGVIVTNSMYAALQTDQGTAGQPSLTIEDVTSVLSASGTAWNIGDFSYITPSGAGKRIKICRRDTTSGTNASSDIQFMNSPCASASPTFGALVPADNTTPNPSGQVVVLNTSTGNVKTCMNNTETDANPNNRWAIGVVSMENTPNPATPDRWKFVKLNGVSPDSDTHQTENFANGNYPFGFETTLFYKNSLSNSAKTFFNALCTAMGDPATAPKGLVSLPTSGCTYAPGVACARFSRGGNSCQAPQ